MSPSARKVWIEICQLDYDAENSSSHLPQGWCGLKSALEWYEQRILSASPSARKVWIEIDMADVVARFGKSPSARKVWIEIKWKKSI